MRTIKRDTLLVLLGVVAIVILIGAISNRQSAEAAVVVDTRTALERYVDAYTKYTDAMLDRFELYRAAVARSEWEVFWATMFRIAVAGAVVGLGLFVFRMTPVVVEHYKMRQRLFKTDMGIVVLGYDENGNIIGRSIEPNTEKKQTPPATGRAMVVSHNGKESVVIDNDSGKFVDDYADVSDFLEKALISSSDENSNELPRHDKMGVGGSRWDRMVNGVLKDFFTVQNTGEGIRTFCSSPEYPTLRMLFIAARRRKIPLPSSGSAKKGKKGA